VFSQLAVHVCKAANVAAAIFAVATTSLVLCRMVGNLVFGMCESAVFAIFALSRMSYVLTGNIPIADEAVFTNRWTPLLALEMEVEAPHRFVKGAVAILEARALLCVTVLHESVNICRFGLP
jgi:hypothetical protein